MTRCCADQAARIRNSVLVGRETLRSQLIETYRIWREARGDVALKRNETATREMRRAGSSSVRFTGENILNLAKRFFSWRSRLCLEFRPKARIDQSAIQPALLRFSIVCRRRVEISSHAAEQRSWHMSKVATTPRCVGKTPLLDVCSRKVPSVQILIARVNPRNGESSWIGQCSEYSSSGTQFALGKVYLRT
jgi:hypothetical protein